MKTRIVEFKDGTFGVEARWFFGLFSGGFMDANGFPSLGNPHFWIADHYVNRNAKFQSLAKAKHNLSYLMGESEYSNNVKRVVND